MRNVALLLAGIAWLTAGPAAAQLVERPRPETPSRAPAAVAAEGPRVLHVTDWLMSLPESRAALDEYQARRAAGLLPVAGKTAAVVGTTQEFDVNNFSTGGREPIDFTLVITEERFDIWVETAEYQNRVSYDQAEQLRAALADRTPAGSIDPTTGIIANNERIFGEPPDADGDGRTDILVLDIRDDFETTGEAILGFFAPSDLTYQGGRDIIYLDVDPGLTLYGDEEVLQTAAHEYQHLIHARYDANETTFVNEGLSEWAEVINGYRARSVSYLDDLAQQRRPLFDWPAGTGNSVDYQRAGLFTNYFAERIGPEATGALVQEAFDGASGYNAVLQRNGLDLYYLVRDFHVANFVNDRSLGEPYGYATPQYAGISARARSTRLGSGSTGFPAETFGPLQPGSVDYHVIEDIADLRVTIVPPDGDPDPTGVAARLSPMIVLTREDGTSEIHELPVQQAAHQFTGTFQEAVIVVPNAKTTRPDASVSYELSATWTPATPSFLLQDIAYESGGWSASLGLPADFRAANRFEVPDGATLASVSVALLYDHDFGDSTVPASAPRDYRLSIYGENVDPRLPADEPLFTLDRTDPRSASITSVNGVLRFVFDRIDLAAFQAEMSVLPPVIFVAIENFGSDQNVVVPSVALFDLAPAESPSLFYTAGFSPPGWRRFDQLQSGGTSLGDRVLPIRAHFVIPVDREDEPGLPSEYALEPNWPNPFNPSTTIAWRIPDAGPVRLSVFDLLGRRVATLVDGVLPAGRHETRFDATGLASGVYLYTLEAGPSSVSRPMILMK